MEYQIDGNYTSLESKAVQETKPDVPGIYCIAYNIQSS